MIIVRNQEEVKKVTKPWGYEIWFAEPGNGDKFALKKIFIKAPHQSSFQFHEKKEETIFISEGTGVLHYSNKKIDIDAFKKNHYSDNDLLNIINNLDKKNLTTKIIFDAEKMGSDLSRKIVQDTLKHISTGIINLLNIFRQLMIWQLLQKKMY